jgi:hypothetical protein
MRVHLTTLQIEALLALVTERLTYFIPPHEVATLRDVERKLRAQLSTLGTGSRQHALLRRGTNE